MSQISVAGLTFAYDGSYDTIFENVSFQIDTDWKLGFIGRNGRGKTTFLKLLLGKYDYSGTISASVQFDYFPFEVADASKTTRDVIESVSPHCEDWVVSRELSLLGVREDVIGRPFNTLSNGEQTKVLLCALFIKENHFLLIDEPTNHLDMESRKAVSSYLQSKHGYILVSHDRAFLDGCIDHVLSINKTDIEVQRGNFSSWQREKDLRDSYEIAENERLKGEIRSLKESAKRTAGWSDAVEKTKYATRNSGLRPDRGYIGRKSAKMMKRAKATDLRRQRAVEEKAGLLKNLESADSLRLHPLYHHAHRLVEGTDVAPEYGGKAVCAPLNFTVEQGERVALCGKNGCGKSSILKLLAGEQIAYSGILRLASGVVVSYVPQDAGFLKGDIKDFVEENRLDEPLFKAILRKLDFSRVQFEKNMEDFSGGQKKKVLIARSLCQQAHLYLWDEPLNFIDVLSRIQIEQLILEFQPTMVFVEHDSAFVEKIATKSINF